MQPVYETLPGWQDDLTSITQAGQLPQALQHYIQFIENELKVPVKIVSVGPNRLQTMWR